MVTKINKKVQQELTYGSIAVPSVVTRSRFAFCSSAGLDAMDLVRKLTIFAS